MKLLSTVETTITDQRRENTEGNRCNFSPILGGWQPLSEFHQQQNDDTEEYRPKWKSTQHNVEMAYEVKHAVTF